MIIIKIKVNLSYILKSKNKVQPSKSKTRDWEEYWEKNYFKLFMSLEKKNHANSFMNEQILLFVHTLWENVL